MEQKHAYVHSWLQTVFSEGEVPPYEVNSGTLDTLYKMASQCQEREAQAQLLLTDLEQKTTEYQAETCRLKAVTDWVGVSLSDLTPTAASCLTSLTEAALALNIADCSDTSFCLALSRLSSHGVGERVAKEELVRKLAALRDEFKTAVLEQVSQQRVLSQLSSEVRERQVAMEKQKRETVFLRQKSEQYQKQASSMKAELEGLGYQSALGHSALLEGAREVSEIQGQLAPLKAQLVSYKDLPPDLDLARVKVEEARRKLLRLEAELASKIDLVHVEN
ncbi:HAUS augmin-like complex subunit 1 [Halichondria panicea]|uniref:HAUS augmin-like complex subunit 1 n=1 Tax=Halichondria panicea TaxID=6063 RepID=UPI00312B2D44